jgi:hypothetical protein
MSHRRRPGRFTNREEERAMLKGSVTIGVLYPGYRKAAGYGPANLDMAQFLPVSNGWGTKFIIPGLTPRRDL